MARDNYQQKENRGAEKPQVANLNDAVSNPGMDNFMKALQCLVLPEKLIDAHFQIFRHSVDLDAGKLTNEMFHEALEKLHRDVFVKNHGMKASGYASINGYKEKLQQLSKMNWNTQQAAITEKLREVQISIAKGSNRRLTHIELHKLCNWLAEYKWCGDKYFLELPGQYTGESKPFVEQHVKIVRFEQRLKVFCSKQLPIELKILGSDGRTYSFIVKYGEDLRQDQRIQQVLELMSRQLAADKNCNQNRLKLQTYQVIPINSNCGLLSVVQNAMTMNEYLQEASKELMAGTTFQEYLPMVKEEFRKFLIGNGIFRGWAKTYENAVLNRSRSELIEELTAKEALFPSDIIRRTLMSSALTLETYFILRKNFITSLATMNIAHWLLGIGDRHLSNILVDVKTGRLIGIDFGIAFGAAANLIVPELVPFRLTSHFVNVLEPMGIEGMIKKNMIHVLRCFRNSSRAILVCLEMFVKEPTLDWLLRSKMKSVGNVDDEVSLASSDWNPEARIAIVQRKLDGANPVKVIQDELSISQVAANAPLLEAYKKLASGEAGSFRSKASDDGLSVEDQVTSLIEMATDKAILALIYLGWDPWI